MQGRESALEKQRADAAMTKEKFTLNEQEQEHLREVARLKGESNKELIRQAQTLVPDWQPQSPASAGEEAKTIIEQKGILPSYISARNDVAKATAERNALIAKVGNIPPVDNKQLGQMILNDPGIQSSLTPAAKVKLANGDVDELVRGLSNSSFVNWGQWFTGPEAQTDRKLQAALLTSAATARQALQAKAEQSALMQAGAAGQAVNSRYEEANARLQALLPRAAAVPGLLSNLPPVPGASGGAGGMVTMPDGTQRPYGGGGASGSGLAASALAALPGANAAGTAAPVVVPPGTPKEENPAFYAHKSGLAKAQNDLTQKISERNHLEQILKNGGETYTPASNPWGAPSSPTVDEWDTDRLGKASERYFQLNKEIKSATEDVDTHAQALAGLEAPLSAPPPPPPAPGTISQTPPTWSPPPGAPPGTSQMMPNLGQAAGQPPATANAANPVQVAQATARIRQIFGTNDPAILGRVKQYAHAAKGMSDQQVASSIQAAVAGDPNAVQTWRQIMSESQQQQGAPPSLMGSQQIPLQGVSTNDPASSLGNPPNAATPVLSGPP